jgi:hypothetical protein
MDMRRHGDEGRNATCTKLVDRLPAGRSAVPVLVAAAVAALGAAAPYGLSITLVHYYKRQFQPKQSLDLHFIEVKSFKEKMDRAYAN